MNLHQINNKHLIENKKLLVLCPSRERIEKLKRMVSTFKEKSSPMSGLIVYIDNNDPQLEQYQEFLSDKVCYVVGKQQTTTQIFNELYRTLPCFEYYALSNDDFEYQTACWDASLRGEIEDESEGWGIAYGNDKIAGDKYCSHPIISNKILKQLGWIQLPSLQHLCGDWVWTAIGKALGRLYYLPNVIIKHNHPFDKQTTPDKIFNKTNSMEMYKADQSTYKHYIKTQIKKDIDKILHGYFQEKKFDKTLSLCMIIKQTENPRIVKQCIESIVNYVDEIVVYVNYKNIPNPLYIRRIKRLIWSFGKRFIFRVGKFNNFSESRNITLRNASSDYIIWLDADDVVPMPHTIKDILCRFPNKDVFLCHVVSPSGYKGKGTEHITQSRLFKNHKYMEFRNNVHEDVSYSYKENNAKVLKTDIIVKHLGNASYKNVMRKNKRNYNLTLKEINKPDAHSLTYFAMVNELMLLGDEKSLIEAIQWIDKFFDKFPDNGKDPLVPKMWILKGACAIDCGHIDAAKTNLQKAWGGWKHPEAAVMLGECHIRKQEWDQAINILEEVNSIEEFEVCNVPIDMHTLHLMTLFKLGLSYYSRAKSIQSLASVNKELYNKEADEKCKEDYEKAKKCYEEYLSLDPNNIHVGDKLVDIYRLQGKTNEANSVTVSLVNMFKDYAVGWKNLGMFELMNKRHATALVFFEKALSIDKKDKETINNVKQLKRMLYGR